MTVSLFDLGVPNLLQTMRVIGGCLEKAREHLLETSADPDDVVTSRLIEDMAPFHFQIECLANHSFWAFETTRLGQTAYPPLIGEMPIFDLQKMVTGAESRLEKLTPGEVYQWSGKSLALRIGPRDLAFTSENFLLSFALPNFFFHAVTAYDILRSLSAPLGKRDFEGQLQTQSHA